ncbi:hypothetical protein J5N97_008008 [Dioscorea zingiberensis]|uniref:Uncharacterized protein n=1 Tax=Dioscorea zingiberensis TaxID=325984 RepID=A0A9D5H2E8_9LILI|nr:hypothetical protein J5N97_001385 [Dioscorea zingiberensis]KAJ0989652.1 hypothetical protein J5N97_008008 [Dioscorea zingiberensis]
MGGSQSSSKSSSSSSSSCMCFGFSQGSRDDDIEYEPRYMSKVRPSDEDRIYWVGDPGVNTKTKDFITKFHEDLS